MGNVNVNTLPVDPSFGFGWKFNLVNGTLQFPGAAPDLFYCQGNRNKFIVVAPSLKLVAAWRDCPEITPDRRPFVIKVSARLLTNCTKNDGSNGATKWWRLR